MENIIILFEREPHLYVCVDIILFEREPHLYVCVDSDLGPV